MDLIFVDVETTGGSISHDRLTEIAIIRVRHGQEISRWSTLLDPEQRLTPFIQQLTGINNAMLADAPLFSEVAHEVKQQLANGIFVAHNARFDYGFVKNEFIRAGISWMAQTLCTVKLSRKLYPQYHKHGLDQIIARHHIVCESRHRAMADADATMQFYLHARQEFGEAVLAQQVELLIKRPTLPQHLPADMLERVPTTAGVYRFWDKDNQLLYVGHGRNLAQRVSDHFQAHAANPPVQHITHIDWDETAGPLGAQLLEWQVRAQCSPRYGKGRQKTDAPYSFRLEHGAEGHVHVVLSDDIDAASLDQQFGLFNTSQEAKRALQGIMRAHNLCCQLRDADHPHGACCMQAHCTGHCQGTEPAEPFTMRVQLALHSLQLKAWPWDGPIAIREHNSFTDCHQSHVFWQWQHLVTLTHEHQWPEWQATHSELPKRFNPACYRLLMRYLFDGKQAPDVVLL